ncbi:DNA polymerase [Vibrio phage vB_VmeM-32]|nr:DNA polymerase [Vibrio phage vB_VmeM-32]
MSDSELESLSDAELEYVIKFAREQEKMNNVIQLVRKILINSLYGALGNAGFRFYDVRLAEAITTGGQLSIRWIERKLNEFMNKLCETKDDDYITYIDTDSVYMSVQKFVEKMCKKKGIAESDKTTAEWVDLLDNFAKNICEPYIAKSYQEMADYMNAYEQRMFMDREVIADCLTGDMLVNMSGGSKKRLDAIRVGDYVQSYNETTGEIESNEVLAFMDKGIQDVYLVKLDDGRTIQGTADHKIGCIRDDKFCWVNLIDLRNDSDIIVVNDNLVTVKSIVSNITKIGEKESL